MYCKLFINILNTFSRVNFFFKYNFSKNELFKNHIEITKNTVSTSFLELKKIRNTKKCVKLLLFNKLF